MWTLSLKKGGEGGEHGAQKTEAEPAFLACQDYVKGPAPQNKWYYGGVLLLPATQEAGGSL